MSTVSHERQVLQDAAGSALSKVWASWLQLQVAQSEVNEAQRRAEARAQRLTDDLLIFSQFNISVEEARPFMDSPVPDGIGVETQKQWEKIRKRLQYAAGQQAIDRDAGGETADGDF